jgi:hypothetical protein
LEARDTALFAQRTFSDGHLKVLVNLLGAVKDQFAGTLSCLPRTI